MKTAHSILTLIAVAAIGTILAQGCGGSSGSSGSTASATGTATGGNTGGGNTVNVTMTGSHTFNPVNASAAVGDTVRWSNPDTTTHTATSDTGGRFDSGGVLSGGTFSYTIPAGTASGTVIYYHCSIHGAAGNGTSIGPGMAGSITVQ